MSRGRTHRMLLEAANSTYRYNLIVAHSHNYAQELLLRFSDYVPGLRPPPEVSLHNTLVDTDGRRFLFTSVSEPEEITERVRGRNVRVLWDHKFWDAWRARGNNVPA